MKLILRYRLWWRWYKCDIRLLNGYTWAWLTKGKFPYCLAAIPPYLFTLLVLAVIYACNPLFDRPPTFGAGFIGPLHYFMRTGKIRLSTPKSRVWEVLYANRSHKYRRKIRVLRSKRRTLYRMLQEGELPRNVRTGDNLVGYFRKAIWSKIKWIKNYSSPQQTTPRQ